jgi:O-antigen/teichoic acid export membrane protein
MSDARQGPDEPEMPGDAPPPADESEKERLDRNLMELLGELRVALPGVQVLFAFLLAVPFQQGFADVTAFQRDVYFATLLCALVASACLIAPTAFHRITFRMQQKPALVAISNRLAIAGLAALALAMTGAILLISDVLFGTATVVVATALAAALLVVLWAVLPLRHRRRHG